MADSPMMAEIPVIGFVAFSGTGKTTLLERVLPILKNHGVRVGLLKHAHHDFDIDIPGKDSYRLRKAGAVQTMVASHRRWALITEHAQQAEPNLHDALERFDRTLLDLVLVEGFKHERFPKIEVRRGALGKPRLYPNDSAIIAVVTDEPEPDCTLPCLPLDDSEAVARFLLEYSGATGNGSSDSCGRA